MKISNDMAFAIGKEAEKRLLASHPETRVCFDHKWLSCVAISKGSVIEVYDVDANKLIYSRLSFT